MSAPLVVNTTDGTVWTRRKGSRGGEALYAPEKCQRCPEFVMATLTELAEHGIARSADVLPMPVGPQLPEFPPPPATELEDLRAERARLQDLLAEAVSEKHRALRERDLMRERVAEPFGCKHCGEAKRSHGRRYIGGAGMHSWERPTDEQVKDRMLARHAARMPVGPEPVSADDDRAKAPWGRGEDGRPLLPMGAHWTDVPELVDQEVARIRGRVDQAQSGLWRLVSASEGRPAGTVGTTVNGYQRTVGQFTNMLPADLDLVLHAHDDLSWCLEMIAKFRARVAELEAERHTTNEALDDAAKALREQRDRIAELEAAPATVPAAYELATRAHVGAQLRLVIDRCAKRAQQAEMPLRRDLIARGMGLLSALHLVEEGSADNTEEDGEYAGHDEDADPVDGFSRDPIPYKDPVGFPAVTLLARRGIRAGRDLPETGGAS